MKLYIGNKNYSTWSLRSWLLVERYGLKFQETMLKLETDVFYQTLSGISPTNKVPLLVDGDVIVWESLAICEYINETYLSGKAWPEDPELRARARSLSSEMHSGFLALRSEMPMNIRAKRYVDLSVAAQKDIARIAQIWREQMREFGQQGGWLFGEWSIADAMFAPVVMRFITYGIEPGPEATAYMEKVLACPAIQRWRADALLEQDIVPSDEAGTPSD
ncbi:MULTISPECIES: glutathione S-transferase family protein [unclassified Pseudoalteromonas]|uniref:glutathione S-transferase family protein n=1 Tax=unclassified Pseudoalteromonas TaxID=194690 RepID=UPI0020981F50|nr:glutathione S-transferase family protein [Pseudoalteromonas sp. XMcav2-N]MCO7190860.1 glutathione S-transferase family protein [Pseudoalteromonas sp. XMcav2-N]